MGVTVKPISRLIWHYDNGPIKLWDQAGFNSLPNYHYDVASHICIMIKRTLIVGFFLGCVSSVPFPWFVLLGIPFFVRMCTSLKCCNFDMWFPDGFHVVSYALELPYSTRVEYRKGPPIHHKVYNGTPRYFAYRKSPRIDLHTPTQKCTAYFCAYPENGDVATYRGWGLRGISDVYIESLDIEAGSTVEVSKAGLTECNGIYVFDPSALPPRGDSIGCMQGIYKHESNPNVFIGFENGSAIGYPERNKWAIFNSEGIIYSAHTNGSGAGTPPREGLWDMAATTGTCPNGDNWKKRIIQFGSKRAAIGPPPEVHAILHTDVGKSKNDGSCSDTIIQIDDVKPSSKKVNLEKFRYNEGHNRYRIGYFILTALFSSCFWFGLNYHISLY